MSMESTVKPILNTLEDPHSFQSILLCNTPDAWLEKALESIDILLIDHANCEKKAAATAINLMFRYTKNITLQQKMSRLAREELRHYEQVLALMLERKIQYIPLSAAHYAEKLRKVIRTVEPKRLIDTLIVAAIIEARSCERFSTLVPYIEPQDEPLARYYRRLHKQEARHFQDYLQLAYTTGNPEEVNERIRLISQIEHDAILCTDKEFRFHSGIPKV